MGLAGREQETTACRTLDSRVKSMVYGLLINWASTDIRLIPCCAVDFLRVGNIFDSQSLCKDVNASCEQLLTST